MNKPRQAAAAALFLALCLSLPAWAGWKVVEEKALELPGHPESVAWDPSAKCFYVSNFGPELKPTQKDGRGTVWKLDQNGRVISESFLPRSSDTLNKPKGLWVENGRLWTTDIDSVWVFDLTSRNGRRLPLPGASFANDPVVAEGVLFISDTGSQTVYKVEPADFLEQEAKVGKLEVPKGASPNGLWVAENRKLIMVGSPQDGGGGIYVGDQSGHFQARKGNLGRLDGLAVLPDGSVLFTDWASGSLKVLDKDDRVTVLAEGFGGPADFALAPRGKGFLVAVPDLVKGGIRMFYLEQ